MSTHHIPLSIIIIKKKSLEVIPNTKMSAATCMGLFLLGAQE